MDEIWKDIDGLDGLYQISNLGRIKSLGRYSLQNHWLDEKILKISHSHGGYCDVSLYKDGIRIHKKLHRLVAEAFVPNPNNLPEIDHIDTDKDNNSADNLRWCTHVENYRNPLTRKLMHKTHVDKKPPESVASKKRKAISVYKDGVFIYRFKSRKELRDLSEEKLGVKLWPIYAVKVLRGEMVSYHGFTFKEE